MLPLSVQFPSGNDSCAPTVTPEASSRAPLWPGGPGLRTKEAGPSQEQVAASPQWSPEAPRAPWGGGGAVGLRVGQKWEVNGSKAHLLFAFLREALPAPSDDPTALMTDPKFITWSPVCRNDVSWNFEKFLVGPDGVPVRRYSRRFPTIDIKPDIQALLSKVSGGA